MLSRLSYDGTAAFLLANGALGIEGVEQKIRKQLIENNKIEAIIVLPRDMFYATDISVTLWICGNNKKEREILRNGQIVKLRNRENEILFIDARMLGDNGNNDDGFVNLTEDDKNRIVKTLFEWQDMDWKNKYYNVPEFCYSATKEELKEKNYTLVPSKYIEFIDKDLNIQFDDEIKIVKNKLSELIVLEENNIKDMKDSFRGIGYEID